MRKNILRSVKDYLKYEMLKFPKQQQKHCKVLARYSKHIRAYINKIWALKEVIKHSINQKTINGII